MAIDTPLTIVSASRLTAEAFPAESLLGRSLRLPAHRSCDARISTGNREPLAAIYNQAIDHLDPATLVVFCHDDLWLGTICLGPVLQEALEHFDLVGEICHGDPQASELIRFGPSPAPASLSWMGCFLRPGLGCCRPLGCALIPPLPFTFMTWMSATAPGRQVCGSGCGPSP
ncbi:MAG: hypothetical protein VKO44_04280 [Cyanobacteriota bacterium]|nr:hypothetical protein [Cyanobacteriota bacterium]